MQFGAKRARTDVAALTQLFNDKLEERIAQRKELRLKTNCILENGKILMMCVVCKICQPRTPEFFQVGNGSKNFKSSEPGHEFLRNSVSYPCKNCYSVLTQKYRATEDGFITNLLSKYPLLSVTWFHETLKKQNGKGLISNTQMNLTTNGENCAGIHRYSNIKEHITENCFLEIQELNAAQGNAIPDLFEAWKSVYSHFVACFVKDDETDYLKPFQEHYHLKPKELGLSYVDGSNSYNKACYEKHFPTILHHMIKRHINEDIKKNRFQLPPNVSRAQFIKMVYPNAIVQLEKQKAKCAYTNVGLTIKNLWTRFSFERINNDLPHFTADGKLANCIFICRLFNVSRQLSTRKILDIFLHQILVDVPIDVRKKAQNILNGDSPQKNNFANTKEKKTKDDSCGGRIIILQFSAAAETT